MNFMVCVRTCVQMPRYNKRIFFKIQDKKVVYNTKKKKPKVLGFLKLTEKEI